MSKTFIHLSLLVKYFVKISAAILSVWQSLTEKNFLLRQSCNYVMLIPWVLWTCLRVGNFPVSIIDAVL